VIASKAYDEDATPLPTTRRKVVVLKCAAVLSLELAATVVPHVFLR